MAAQRIPRLLRLMMLLHAGGARTTDDLITELDVSRRTLFRDLETLRNAGIHYYHSRTSGYCLARDSCLPPVNLTVPETLGLMLLAKVAISQRRRAMMVPALSAIAKFCATVPEPIRVACNELMAQIWIDPGPQVESSAESEHYTTLQRCIDEGRACRVVYKSPAQDETLQCELEPYALHFVSRAWYVLARSPMHDSVRVFKLARFHSVTLIPRRFRKPRRFKPADVMGKAWQMIPEGRIYQVELEFTAKVATNVTEVHWHASQKHEFLPDGRCRMTFEVDGFKEIAWWVCGYADQVVVKNPPELRERVQEMLRSALKHYDSPEPGEPAKPVAPMKRKRRTKTKKVSG